MNKINIQEAKINLSKYLDLIKSGKEKEIIICIKGIECAKLTPIEHVISHGLILGVAKRTNKNLNTQFLDKEISNDFESEIVKKW